MKPGFKIHGICLKKRFLIFGLKIHVAIVLHVNGVQIMKLFVFFCLLSFTLAISSHATPRRSSISNKLTDGYFFRLYFPSLKDSDGVPNQFYIYKVIPTTSVFFRGELFNSDPGSFVPYTFLNKADFISFFNPKKPNKTIFRIVLGKDAVVLGREADPAILRSLVKEPYFEGEIRVWKNGHIFLKGSKDCLLDEESLKEAGELAASFFNGFGFILSVSSFRP